MSTGNYHRGLIPVSSQLNSTQLNLSSALGNCFPTCCSSSLSYKGAIRWQFQYQGLDNTSLLTP